MKTCEPAKVYLPVPGPTSLCAYLVILFTCGTVMLLTRSWGGYRKPGQLAKVCFPVSGPTSTSNIVHLWYNNPFDSVLGGLQENLLACQRLFASSETDKYLQYWSLGIQLSCCSVLRGLWEIYSVKSTVSSVLALPTSQQYSLFLLYSTRSS